MGLKKGDLVKVINKKLSCYGAVGRIVEVYETKEGKKIYRIKVSPSTARFFYAYHYLKYEPLEECDEELLIWGDFTEEDLELIS